MRLFAGSKLQEEPIEMPLFYYNVSYGVYCSITLLFSAQFLLMFKLRLLIANQIKESCHSFDWFKIYVIIKTHLILRTGSNFRNVNMGLAFCLLFPGPSYVFTTLDAKEETGPRNTSGYVGTSLEGNVILYRGIQIWSVPATGNYVIEALGASGGDSPRQIQSDRQRLGGLGAKIRGTFQLKERTILKILVGQEGGNSSSAGDSPGGGGGGSFVTLLDSTPLIIAGGGGGGGAARDQFTDGDPGQATGDGTQCGGREGAGGQICNADTGRIDLSLKSGGGAGLNGDGARGGTGILIAAQSFINGGTGGIGPSAKGGFGGGGYATVLGGGGGGYSGGGVVGTLTKGTAGGGGSYNNGTEQLNISGINKGDGKVIIKFMN